VLVVCTTLSVPDQLDRIDLTIDGPTEQRMVTLGLAGDGRISLPGTLTLVPENDGVRTVTVTAHGTLAGVPVVDQSVRVSFVPGESRVVSISMFAACAPAQCPNQQCDAAGQCQPLDIDQNSLASWNGTVPSGCGSSPNDAGTPSIAFGAYIHDVPQTLPTLDAYASTVGGPPAIVMWFSDWSSDFPAGGLDAIIGRGAMPMISWKPEDPSGSIPAANFAFANIASGSFDAYLQRWASAAASFNRPFYVRFAYSMNGTWENWGIGQNGNTAANFVMAWQHVVTIFRNAGATNVRWIFCPSAALGSTTPVSLENFFPGNDWVDAIGLTGYNKGGSNWIEFRDLFGGSYDRLVTLSDKPVMIVETASVEAGGDKAAWIRNGLLTDLPTRFPRVRALVWAEFVDGSNDWRAESSPGSLTAFREVVASDLFHGHLQ
jgi:beta-mannanase